MSARRIEFETVLHDRPDGTRVIAVIPVIPDAAPYRIREGIARRRIAALTGRCPCGAEVSGETTKDARGLSHAAIQHEDRCPADDDGLVKAIRRWAR